MSAHRVVADPPGGAAQPMRARPAGLAALLAAALTLGLLPPATAHDVDARKKQVDASVERLRENLADTSRELAGAVMALQQARSALPAAEAAVARVRGRLVAARAHDAELARQLTQARTEEATAERELERVVAEMAHNKEILGLLARQAYQTGNLGQLAVVLDAETPDDLATRIVLVRSVLRSGNDVLDDLAGDRAEVAARTATLEAKREHLGVLKRESEEQLAVIRRLERSAEQAKARVEALIADAAQAAATVKREKHAEELRLSQMEAEQSRISALLAERARAAAERAAAVRAAQSSPEDSTDSTGGGAVAPAPSSGGRLLAPVTAPISSPYGMRQHPITGEYKLHDGTDFAVACGTPVLAAASGVVVDAGWRGGWGNRTVLDHGQYDGVGLATAYNHLTSIAVSAGQSVQRGQVVGLSGTTGSSTGCHLHFNVYVNGATVDPMGWL